jgi:serine/threonine-protein kinase
MVVVFEGHDLRLQRRAAIKVLPLSFAHERREPVQRFQREARAASLLSHPNIVSIFDADFARGWCYIAMEFVEGKTLRQLMESDTRPLDAKSILDWIGQTAAAWSAAHQADIVHRDIKPENIMLRDDGTRLFYATVARWTRQRSKLISRSAVGRRRRGLQDYCAHRALSRLFAGAGLRTASAAPSVSLASDSTGFQPVASKAYA